MHPFMFKKPANLGFKNLNDCCILIFLNSVFLGEKPVFGSKCQITLINITSSEVVLD